jgi:hypothetical protein
VAKNDALTCDNIYKEKKKKPERRSIISNNNNNSTHKGRQRRKKKRAGVATKNRKHDNESNNYKINGCSLCDNTRLAERFV